MNAINELATSALYRLDGSDNDELVAEVVNLKRWGNALAMGDTTIVQHIVDNGWGMEFERTGENYYVRLWTHDDAHDSCWGYDPDLRHALIKAYLDWQDEVRLA